MKTMQKLSVLFLMSIVVTSSSYSMEKTSEISSSQFGSRLWNLFRCCRNQQLDIPSDNKDEVMYDAESSEEESSSEEGEWFAHQVHKTFSSIKDPYMSIEGSSVQELEQVSECAPFEAQVLLAKILNPEGYRRGINRGACLVGDPGVGKSTLAKALGYIARVRGNWQFVFYSSKDFGRSNDQRNSAGNRLRETLERLVEEDQRVIVIIDEINKLLENHKSSHHDTGDTATALWTFLDKERFMGRFFLIGTANAIDEIPEPFKERLQKNIVEIPKPTAEMKRKIFCAKLIDPIIIVDKECDDAFFNEFLSEVSGWSGRSLEDIIDEAIDVARKNDLGGKGPVLLKKVHFQKGLASLKHIRENVTKAGHQKETDEERQYKMHADNKEMHKENIKLQKKGQELQDQHFVQNAYIQICQAMQSSLGGNMGVSMMGPSVGASYSSQGISTEGVDGILCTLNSKQKVLLRNRFDTDFKKSYKAIKRNMQKILVKIHEIKAKNYKELLAKSGSQLVTYKKRLKNLIRSFNAAKAELGIKNIASIAIKDIRSLAEEVQKSIPNQQAMNLAERHKNVEGQQEQQQTVSSNKKNELEQLHNVLNGKFLDKKKNDDNCSCVIL